MRLSMILGGSAVAGVVMLSGALWSLAAYDQAKLAESGSLFESAMLASQRDEVKSLQASPNKNTTVDLLKRQQLPPAESPAPQAPQE